MERLRAKSILFSNFMLIIDDLKVKKKLQELQECRHHDFKWEKTCENIK